MSRNFDGFLPHALKWPNFKDFFGLHLTGGVVIDVTTKGTCLQQAEYIGTCIICIGRAPRHKKAHGMTVVVYFIHMGDAASGPTATTFAFLGDLINVINRTDFGTDRFRGFRSVKGRKRPFPILKLDCP